MFCKYCGCQIANDSVFCSKCGRSVLEQNDESTIHNHESNKYYISTERLQWKKPYVARIAQILCIAIAMFFLLYSIVCFINGGRVVRFFGDSKIYSSRSSGISLGPFNLQYEEGQNEENLIVKDYLGIFSIKKKKWNQRHECLVGIDSIPWAFSVKEIDNTQNEFKALVFF